MLAARDLAVFHRDEGHGVAAHAAGGDGGDFLGEGDEGFQHQRVGGQDQVAPAFSAKKFAGRRGYEIARKGEPVPERRSRIEVYAYEPTSELEGDRVEFRLDCSAGTYARSLAHEIGQALECGAHLSRLRRVAVGPLPVEQAVTLDALGELETPGDTEALGESWVPFSEIPLPFPTVQLDVQQAQRITNGQTALHSDPRLEEGDWVRLLDATRQCLAIAVVIESIGDKGLSVLQPKIVFN